jgi:hypothetical protein
MHFPLRQSWTKQDLGVGSAHMHNLNAFARYYPPELIESKTADNAEYGIETLEGDEELITGRLRCLATQERGDLEAMLKNKDWAGIN